MLTHAHSFIHLLIIQRAAVAEGIVFPSCLSVHLSVISPSSSAKIVQFEVFLSSFILPGWSH